MIKIGQSIHPNRTNGDINRLDEELRQIKEAGADCCELVLQGLDAVIGGRVIPARQDALVEALQKYELEYTLHMPHGLNLLDKEMLEIHLDVFRAGIEFSQAAGIKLINYHAGKTKTDDKSLIQKEIEEVKQLAKSAPDILLCMENPPLNTKTEFSAANSADGMIAFYEQVGMENFKLTFDTGHSLLNHNGEKNALLEDLNRLLPYTGHIHLHDNCGTQADMKAAGFGDRLACGIGDIHLPPGWGRLPMEEIFALLKGFGGIVNLEIEHRFRYHYGESISFVRDSLG